MSDSIEFQYEACDSDGELFMVNVTAEFIGHYSPEVLYPIDVARPAEWPAIELDYCRNGLPVRLTYDDETECEGIAWEIWDSENAK